MTSTIETLLDEARWAPSGDNTQPWRFKIVSDREAYILGHDTRQDCVYDLEGHASRIAHGCLLETLRIAASTQGLDLAWQCSTEADTPHPIYAVKLSESPGLEADPRAAAIRTRSVQRRAMSTQPLSPEDVSALEMAATPYRLVWKSTFSDRLEVARLNFRSAKIRLSIREAFEVHRRVIEWGTQFSEDRIPEQAVGVDPLTAKLMSVMLRRWERIDFFNKYLCGTLAPRIQLDLIPGIACATHVLLEAPTRAVAPLDFVNAGMIIQRVWLEAERRGLKLQPELTPLIFSRYARDGRHFTTSEPARTWAGGIERDLVDLFGRDTTDRAVFMCRLGHRPAAHSRSLRLPLARLLSD
jgi:hypothetical protein